MARKKIFNPLDWETFSFNFSSSSGAGWRARELGYKQNEFFIKKEPYGYILNLKKKRR